MEEGGLCSSFAAAMAQGQAKQQQHTFCPVLGGAEIRGSQGFNSEALTQAVQHVERLLKGAPESVMGTVQYIGQNARMCASMPIPNYRTEQVPVPPPPPPLPPIQSAFTVAPIRFNCGWFKPTRSQANLDDEAVQGCCSHSNSIQRIL